MPFHNVRSVSCAISFNPCNMIAEPSSAKTKRVQSLDLCLLKIRALLTIRALVDVCGLLRVPSGRWAGSFSNLSHRSKTEDFLYENSQRDNGFVRCDTNWAIRALFTPDCLRSSCVGS